MMESTKKNYVESAINAVCESDVALCKFLSANDTGETGSHQSGFFIPKNSFSMFFEEPGERGSNKDVQLEIVWQNGMKTQSRVVYYGQKSRNEYRATRFGKGFPYLKPVHTGSLLVLTKKGKEYRGFVLDSDNDINDFLDSIGISVVQTNRLISKDAIPLIARESSAISAFLDSLTEEFPDAVQMGTNARMITETVHGLVPEQIVASPDSTILIWTDMEYKIFRALEDRRYLDKLTRGFTSVDEFFRMAKSAMNRRFSRAGKSLEHHLAAVFTAAGVNYEEQIITEGNKKPDFIFPSGAAYHDEHFPVEKLTFLAVKTTCKDRWRQILNECSRLSDQPKYLFTLQQGISVNQLKEMEAENVILVVPKEYHKDYPKSYQDKLWTLERFIQLVKDKQETSK